MITLHARVRIGRLDHVEGYPRGAARCIRLWRLPGLRSPDRVNERAALTLADQAYVMETGRVVVSGSGSGLLHDEGVRKAYLGED
jgi:hypothetical protein